MYVMDEFIVFQCPHCREDIVVMKAEINCAIFRHGVLKTTGQQMNPHATQQECEQLYKDGLIYGCGKPFRLVNGRTLVCEYI